MQQCMGGVTHLVGVLHTWLMCNSAWGCYTPDWCVTGRYTPGWCVTVHGGVLHTWLVCNLTLAFFGLFALALLPPQLWHAKDLVCNSAWGVLHTWLVCNMTLAFLAYLL